VGRAAARFGQRVADVGEQYRHDQETLENVETSKNLTTFLDGQGAKQIESERGADPTGKDFVKGRMQAFDKDAGDFLKNVSPRLRPVIDAKLQAARGDYSLKSLGFELKQRDGYYRTEAGKMGERAQAGILADPDNASGYEKDFRTFVDETGLPDTDKTALKEKAGDVFRQARVRGLVDAGRDAEAYGAAGGAGDTKTQTKALLRRFEGFKETPYYDVNAHRAGYGSDTTTLPDGTVVSVTADTKVSRDDAERDLDRRVGEFQGKVRGQVGPEKFDALPANVQAVLNSVGYNYGELPAGVAAAAKTGDPQQIAAAIRARGSDNEGVNAKRRNAEADYVLAGTDRMVGEETAGDYTEKLIADRNARERRADATVAAQLAANNKAKVNQLELDVLDGKAGVTDVDDARQAGWLTDATDVGRIQTAINKRNEETGALARVTSGRPLNQFNADDKKAVGSAYTGLIRGGADPLQALDTVYSKTGILPQEAVQGLRGAMVRPDTAEQGLQLASALMIKTPNVFDGYDGGEGIARDAVAFQHYVELGVPPQEAAGRVLTMNSPEYKSKVKLSDAEMADYRKTIKPETVQNAFGLAPWLGSNTPLGFDGQQQRAIVQDFADIAADEFRRTGDASLANDYAARELKRVYGTTNAAGQQTFVKYPPEQAKGYPPVRDENGEPTQAYIYDQAAAEASKFTGKEVKAGDVVLAHIPNVTSRDWNSGAPPRYRLMWLDRSQNPPRLESVPDQAFVADPAAGQKAWDDKYAEAMRTGKPIEKDRGILGNMLYNVAADRKVNIMTGQSLGNE
jgi:GH24 family phage-related lysozyme (muramidase)